MLTVKQRREAKERGRRNAEFGVRQALEEQYAKAIQDRETAARQADAGEDVLDFWEGHISALEAMMGQLGLIV